jgi:hypothetical protein
MNGAIRVGDESRYWAGGGGASHSSLLMVNGTAQLGDALLSWVPGWQTDAPPSGCAQYPQPGIDAQAMQFCSSGLVWVQASGVLRWPVGG